MTIETLVAQLDAFDLDTRKQALRELKAQECAGAVAVPKQVNMHCHTFFSYNGYGASPSRVAYEAWKRGWEAVGTCDFDVLDSKDEFIEACDLLGIRGTVNMETRVFFPEYAEHEINSPGEPGVYYYMGAGFINDPRPGSNAEAQLQKMRKGAEDRNRAMLERINQYLDRFTLDYEADVLPLTPAGNATERHMCTAFYEKSRKDFDRTTWMDFWSDKLGIAAEKADALYDDPMAFNDTCRSKLMKKGGPGYVQPNADTFPAIDDVTKMIVECKAVPMATWLDGTSSGESNITELLECQMAKGVAALNIVPDRNWNLKDAETAALKIRNLHECVAAADKLNLPLNVGTELNKFGQPWVDNFGSEPMKIVAPSFIRGAHIMVGHARLLRFANISYIGDKAKAEFPDTAKRNDFFADVGALQAPDDATLAKLKEQSADANFATLSDAAGNGSW